MPQGVDVLSVIDDSELEDRLSHSVLTALHDFAVIVDEAIDLNDFDVELECRDKFLAHLGTLKLGRVVEDDLCELRLPFLNRKELTLDRFILTWAEKYS